MNHIPNPHIPIACDRANLALSESKVIRPHLSPEAAFVVGLALQKWLFIPASIDKRDEVEESLHAIGRALIELLMESNPRLICLSEITADWVDAVDAPGFIAIAERFLANCEVPP